ncbi:MAG: hypothetical protein JSS81_19990 [Acidobacteria bacterium]|nr:hypothetical protein [Acidobacteriota bacterium]
MAKAKRLSPNRLAEEEGYFTNLKNIPDYHPQKTEFSVAEIQAVVDAIRAGLVEETRLMARLAEVRDELARNGRLLMDKNDGSVIQVAAQFGDDSAEYQSLGRTRRSERGTNSRPRRPAAIKTP